MHPIPYSCLQGMTHHDLPDLTQEQSATLEALRQWLHDYNLGKAPKPDFPPSIRQLVSAFSERKMHEQAWGQDDG